MNAPTFARAVAEAAVLALHAIGVLPALSLLALPSDAQP